jgi:hypothetical protein
MNPQFFEKRPTESQYAFERRISAFLPHREDAETETDQAQAWAEHRAQVDQRTGSGTGLFGNLSAHELAAARGLVGAGHGGEQNVERYGHLANEANHL